MNYRHSFHAGNFADLHKHAVLLLLLKALRPETQGLTVIDTHAGAGIYDLGNDDQARSKEAARGVKALMAGELPGAFAPLIEAVRALNSGQGAQDLYPGSPWLIAGLLGEGDLYIGCEMQPDTFEMLRATMARTTVPTEVRAVDGYEAAGEVSADLILIDPPYERRDDYERAAQTVAAARALNPDVVVAIWTPLKDLETLDGFLRDLKGKAGAEVLVSEARMRPLMDPMKMNGSAMVIVSPPRGLDGNIAAVAEALVEALGEAGGEARLWRA
jgi:23S rRNA (adenine2030-N6)-methyltransferase